MCGKRSLQPLQKALSLLGMAKRAGAVASGVEGVRSLCRSGKARLVLSAEDSSENSAKRIADCCAFYGVRHMSLSCSMAELGHAIGTNEVAAAAVGDAGLARASLKSLAPQQEQEGGHVGWQ